MAIQRSVLAIPLRFCTRLTRPARHARRLASSAHCRPFATTTTTTTTTQSPPDDPTYGTTKQPLYVLHLDQLQSKPLGKPALHTQHTHTPNNTHTTTTGCSVPDMLHIEELLMRGSQHNWLVFSTPPADYQGIVMGIGGQPQQLLHLNNVHADRIPVYKRFTGGGTVYINGGIRFVSLIINQQALPKLQMWPRQIMSYTEQVYTQVFEQLLAHQRDAPSAAEFRLRDNDYCFHDRKFGGNAQSITKSRWLHHTSFLANTDFTAIEKYLLIPERQPQYRQGRTHSDFICSLHEFMPDDKIAQFYSAVTDSCKQWFDVRHELTRDEQRIQALSSTEQVSREWPLSIEFTAHDKHQQPLLAEVERIARYGKYTLATKQVDMEEVLQKHNQ